MNPPESSQSIRFDVVAGLTAAAVILPKAMAYATVAGLPVAAGLYTAFIPMIIYALMGSSRVLSVSSTTTLGILTGTQLMMAVPDGDPGKLITAAATLTVLVGILLIVASLLRLGFVANFISNPVLTGFKAGIGLVIIFDQLPKLLGIHITKQGFFRDLFSIVHHVPETSLITLAVAAATLMVLMGMEHRWPHSPAPLVAAGGGIAASWFFDLPAQSVATVGMIPQGLPSLTMPDLALIEQMLPGALGIALMSFTESIAAARAFAASAEPPINANRELLALGTANLGGALSGAMPAGGGTSQTAVVRAAGGHSQKSSLVTAATAAATMLLIAPLIGLLPHATLAAVVIVYSVGLIQPAEFINILKVRTMEFRWAIVACLGVLIFGTLQGIVVAIILSVIGLASQSAHPRIYVIGRKRGTSVLRPLTPEHPDDETFDGLLIVRPEGRIFFVNTQLIADQIRFLVEQQKPKVLVLDLSRVQDIEYSALQMLMEREKRATENGATLWLTGLNPSVLDVVRRSGLADRLGRERMLFNASTAIERYQMLQSVKSDA
ncbi:MAG: SulP family inorganic anion transporter [Methylicorpusculum sp.]|uniref:SulP family inorganic anion transporter n=1 Tax=Methylicorpusculum sp. TaxID=2713644 RepID=UPI0027270A39|nr:SulP family inorganic anion transporter [Methylicorpusculum sp.]MDO8939111.1 SulP family inorganic anion transporter [Methylicorpusculum sp.]MDP2200690.1 SulP family inorganic anion transporter [Methylicorpusculum sp.]